MTLMLMYLLQTMFNVILIYTVIYDATIEDRYQCDIEVDGKTRKLDILDTAGQEQFAALQHHWIREGDAFLLVYAVNSRATFLHSKKCYQTITRIKEDSRIDLVFVCNKYININVT